MEPHQSVMPRMPNDASGSQSTSVTRRTFLIAGAALATGAVGAAALVGLTRKGVRPLAGGFVDDGSAAGHAIRDGVRPPAATSVVRVPIVIVGGGMAGLSAGWWLRRHGVDRFALLELAREIGGNSRSGANEVSAFPWGAHYVPVPGPQAEHVRLLLAEMGLFKDGVWSERDLCHAPRERTFVHGRWRDGQEEAVATSTADRNELRRFADHTDALRATGEFTIPLAIGVRAGSPLDQMTAQQWLVEHGYRSRAVHWLVDYACRDDFGTGARDASAWAALHYFAAREGGGEAPLTWPEGNARIARHLGNAVTAQTVTGSPVHRVERHANGMRVLSGTIAYECDAVIWAAPTFVASHVVEGARPVPFTYAPWMVSNLVMDRWPRDAGAPAHRLGDAPLPTWDNVIAESSSLGYVVATHQSVARIQERTVWTHYWALSTGDPRVARQKLMAADWRSCTQWVLDDLQRAHPNVRECVSRIDVLRYGHAMARPVPGFLAERAALWNAEPGARVFYANSDVSGLSLFEEAQDRGIRAAERVMARVGGK